MADVLGSIKTAYDLSKDLVNLTETVARRGKVAELQRQILDAQESALAANQERAALIERIGQLEKEVGDLKAWNTEKQRYQLKSIQPGVTVYAPKPGMEGGEEPHYLCTNCYQQGQKSILQKSIMTLADSSCMSAIGAIPIMLSTVCAAIPNPEIGRAEDANGRLYWALALSLIFAISASQAACAALRVFNIRRRTSSRS